MKKDTTPTAHVLTERPPAKNGHKPELVSWKTTEVVAIAGEVLGKPIDAELLAAERRDETPEGPDYNDYLYRGLYSYLDYSKGHLKNLWNAKIKLPAGSVILDIGAGTGHTTLALKRMYPECRVLYNDIIPSVQFDFAKGLFKHFKTKFEYVDNCVTEQKVAMALMLEFNEHIIDCVDLTTKIVTASSPDVLVIANSFTADHPAHCKKFKVHGHMVPRTMIAKIYNKNLRDLGYHLDDSCKTFWNRRPAIWVRG